MLSTGIFFSAVPQGQAIGFEGAVFCGLPAGEWRVRRQLRAPAGGGVYYSGSRFYDFCRAFSPYWNHPYIFFRKPFRD